MDSNSYSIINIFIIHDESSMLEEEIDLEEWD